MTIRVLHVDDNAFDRELVRNALESESGDFQVIEAKSRREFEQRLGQGGFDIVVSDFNILGFDGLQVLDAVAASAPLTPVVIVTGTGTEEIAVEALKRGAADYVIKHISHIQKLPQTIAAVLENCRLKQENERTWQAIRSSEERFRALAQNAPVGIFETDAAGAYVFVNERWAAIVGQAGRVVLGGNWLQTVHPEDRAAVAAAWREVSDQGAEFEAEYRVDSSTAGTRWVWNQATPLHDAQTQVCGYIGTLADITERKLMVEALAQAKLAAEAGSRAKSVFLSNMSHELRTPLSGIMGMLNLSLSCNLGSETAEWLGLAKKAGHSILKIFDDILDLSSIENNAMTLVTRRYSPAEMLRGLTKRFELRAREKGLELTVRLAPDLPAVVLGDVRRLEQVLSNLLDNALKFTQLGEIVIEAGLEEQQPFPTLRFAIQDTGCGVAPENIERLFQPFTQIDDSLAKQFQGTGLGLVIGKKLVEMMEGRIEVQSTARQGSVFTVHLPLRLPQGKAELRAPS